MSNNNTNSSNSSTIDKEQIIGKPYTGPRKLAWVDGQQIMVPDLEAVAQGTPGALQSSYFVPKTIDDYDVISETDEIQFSKLKTDDQKYEMISNMITGVDKQRNPIFKASERYVDGEYRGLKTILQDLIDQKKIWLNPKDGNLFEMEFALKNRMISFHCRNCSKVLFSETERTRHSYSHMARR
jgi:hypothetical protein